MTESARTGRRAEENELAAALARGPVEVLDFILPLWAGGVLGLSPAAIGALIATETLVSLLARPGAGLLADRVDRGRLAAVGALLYAMSFAGYALATGLPMALAAAVTGGIGGALFWVALRARVAEDLAEDSGVFAKLFAAEGTGTWIAFAAAVTLVPQIDYAGVFWLGAAACAVACVVLLGRTGTPAGRGADRSAGRTPQLGSLGRRMRPLLGVVVLTAVAEAGVALLLLLHLQQEYNLGLGAIAAVFLPGFIVYSTVPEFLHAVVTRLGRAKVVSAALVCSAVFAATLSLAPNPWVIAAAWVLEAVAFAAAIPVEQSVIAEAAGVSLGQGMAVYESVNLLGATIGALGAGLLYGLDGGWELACLAAAVLLMVASVLIRPALRGVGVLDRPEPPAAAPAARPAQEKKEKAAYAEAAPDAVAHAESGEPDEKAEPDEKKKAARDEAAHAESGEPDEKKKAAHAESGEPDEKAEPDEKGEPDDEAEIPPLEAWAGHAVIYLVVQVVLVFAGYSWPVEAVFGGPHDAAWFWNSSGHWLLDLGRIWTALLVLDTVWSLGRVVVAARRQ